MKSATAFMPISPASIRSLAMPGLAGLVKPVTASSTRSTLYISRLNISFQCIEELFQYIEL